MANKTQAELDAEKAKADAEAKLKSEADAKAKASKLPQVGLPVVDIPVFNPTPADDQYDDGVFVGAGGEKYALCIREDDPHGKTHHAKNSLHYWNGSKEEFKAQFERE